MIKFWQRRATPSAPAFDLPHIVQFILTCRCGATINIAAHIHTQHPHGPQQRIKPTSALEAFLDHYDNCDTP